MDRDSHLSANDRALVDEAVRRVQTSRSRGAVDREAITAAVADAFQSGRRDLFGLVKAGRRAL